MIYVKFALAQLFFALMFHTIYKHSKLKEKLDYTSFKKILFPITFACAYIVTGLLVFL